MHAVSIPAGRKRIVDRTPRTPYFALLDDDYFLPVPTGFLLTVETLERGGFDILGMRMMNELGIKELKEQGIKHPC